LFLFHHCVEPTAEARGDALASPRARSAPQRTDDDVTMDPARARATASRGA